MIDIGCKKCNFTCDECPIVEEFEYRMKIAEEHPEWGNFQFDHCGCEKVGDEFFMCGYCGDAWSNKHTPGKKGKRKTGRAYRRQMKRQKFQEKKRIAEHSLFAMGLGYDRAGMEHSTGWHWYEPDRVYHYTYVKPRSHSRMTTFWKKHSNRVLRRKKLSLPTQKGNQHKKVFDYWWEIF